MWGKLYPFTSLKSLHCGDYTANVNQPARGKVIACVEVKTSSVNTVVNVEQDLESHATAKYVCTSNVYLCT